MAERSVLVRLKADISDLRSNFNAAAKQSHDLSGRFGQFATKNEQHFTRVGQASLAMGAAAAAGMAVSVRAAVQWQSAWAGVNKTVDGSAKQMAVLEGELRSMARSLPATHTEIAAVAQAAGQLGIQRDSIAGFTKVMIDLGESTDLTAEQAATGLARMSNIMGTSTEDVGRLGATLVDLGNNSATTESEILTLGTRLAAAGKIAGLSESDVLAFAATLTSVGVEAEAGGTALSKVFTSIRDAVLDGGEKLEVFARTAGVTTAEFQQKFGQDAAGAVSLFVGGLGRMNEAGESTTQTFSALELTDQRLMRALLSTAGAGELLNESLVLGNQAWEANTALVDEANKRYETTESKMRVAKNSLNDLAIGIGSTLLPVLAGAADKVAALAEFFGRMPAPVQGLVAILGTLTAVVGLTGGAALIAAPRIIALKASLDILGISAANTGRAMTGLSLAMKGGAIAGAALGIAFALDQVLTATSKSAPGINAVTDALADFGQTGRAAGALAQIVGEDFAGLGEKIAVANQNKFSPFDGEGFREVTTAREEIKALDSALAGLVQSGNAELAGSTLAAAGLSAEQAADAFPVYAEALAGVAADSKIAAAGIGQMGDAAGDAAGPVQELTEAQKALESALASFTDPMTAYTDLVRESAEATAAATASSEDSWSDYADSAVVSLDQLADRLEQDTQDALDWQANLTTIAATLGADVASELATMGAEGQRLTAQMADDTTGEAERMGAALVSNARLGKEGVGRELDAMIAIAGSKGRETADSLAAQLGIGVGQVRAIAAQYGLQLADGINPILTAIGRYPIAGRGGRVGGLVEADGGVVDYYADGGVEDHRAQIAPAGAMRLWAEPETGGEAYIPLAQSKRARSLEIWQETGRRLQAFARGGFAGPGDVPRPPSTAPFGTPVSTAADRGMDLMYGEAADFVQANAAPALGPGIGWQAMMAALRTRFPNLPLNSGFRPGSITATGNPSYHGMGRAVDIPPRMDVNKWIAENYRAQTRELIFSVPGATQLRNGSPHVYTGITKAMHYDHNHWAMARGGILNPHVRDRGGPLLPGMTYNGTGAPEMVLPMAAGGLVGGSPSYTGGHFAGQAAALSGSASAADMQAFLRSWETHLSQLAEAARRSELVRQIQHAHNVAAVALADDQVRANENLADAYHALSVFDRDAARDAERQSVNLLIDSLEREEQARQDAAAAADQARRGRYERTDNRFELGMMDPEKYAEMLAARMQHEVRYSNEWTSLHRQREAVLADQAAAERALTDAAAQEYSDRVGALREALTEQQRVQESALDRLNGFLDQEASIRGRMASAEGEFYTRSAALQQDYQDARTRSEADFAARSVQAARSYATTQAQILAQQAQTLGARRDELFAWADMAQVPERRWANSAGELIRNARVQAQQFADWMDELATARGRGLSEEVIGALGLDDGPQALDQLHQLNRATASEIADLNAEVTRRTALAGEQVRDEQSRGFASVAAEMAAAQQAYNAEMAELSAAHRLAQAEALAAFEEAASGLRAAFVADQEALSVELGRIGVDQGRSYADALAGGIASGLPAIRAAADQALAAMSALTQAQVDLDRQEAAAIIAPPTTTSAPIGGGTAKPGSLLEAARYFSDLSKRADRTTVAGLRKATFDVGGWLQPGLTLAYNGTGAPERVITQQQMGGASQSVTVNINAPVYGVNDLQRTIRGAIDGTLSAHRTTAAVAGARG